jgi:anti-sigma B factor antagonist
MHTELDVCSPRETDSCYVTVQGAVHFSEAHDLKRQLFGALRAGRSDLVVDISGVSLISCEGLAALLSARREADRLGGQLSLVPPREPALGVFRVTGLMRLFTFLD